MFQICNVYIIQICNAYRIYYIDWFESPMTSDSNIQ